MLWAMPKRSSLAASAERIALRDLHRFFDDGAADPHPLLVAGAAAFIGYDDERPIGLRAHDDEPAVGLREDLEQAFEQFRQDVFHGERLGEAVGDFHQRGQLHFRLGRETPTDGTAAHIERGHDAGAAGRGAVIDQFGDARFFQVAQRIEQSRCVAGVKAELLVADDEPIAFAERRPFGYARIVEERTIAAL